MDGQVIAADTWGIPGSRFLLYFVAAAVVAWVASAVIRRALAGGEVRRGWQPDPEQLAYAVGGRQQAVVAVVAALRADGVITTAGRGVLAVTGRPPSAPGPLTWAVYQAAERGARLKGLVGDPALRPVFADLRRELTGNGWLLPRSRRTLMRTVGVLPVLAVLALGAARIQAGLANYKPAGFLISLTVLVGLAALIPICLAPRLSRAATRELAQMRASHAHLSPSSHPSMATYGAAGAAMSVGLFGTAALFSADPAFAADLELSRQAGWSSSSGGGSCGGGGSSSCGSGGGGSSCGGGGSSCGGGGGGCGG